MKPEEMRDALVAQLPPDQAARVLARDEAARAICLERGWNIDCLTIDQVLAVRADERWRAA